MFVESFQGQYKDGTNGSCDYRIVSGLFLILRILIMASFMASLFSSHCQLNGVSVGVQFISFVVASGFYAVVKPYKLNYMSNVDYLVLTLLELLSIGVNLAVHHTGLATFGRVVLVATLILGVPHMVLIFYICYVLAKKAGITQCLNRKYENLKRCVQCPRHVKLKQL